MDGDLLGLQTCVSDAVFATRSYLEMEITLSQDQISKYADKILLYSNTCVKELRRLFLVQDLVDSLKVCLKHSLLCIRLDKHGPSHMRLQ